MVFDPGAMYLVLPPEVAVLIVRKYRLDSIFYRVKDRKVRWVAEAELARPVVLILLISVCPPPSSFSITPSSVEMKGIVELWRCPLLVKPASSISYY